MSTMIPCAGHTLNLVVQHALAIPGLVVTLGRCRKIVEHFHRSRLDNEELKSKQKQLDLPQHQLVQEVVTRWNSTLDMVTRLCEQQAAIAAVLQNLHHLELPPQEWHNMEDIVKLLEPFKDAIEVLSGQRYPTLSCLAPILKDLRDKLAVKADDSNVLKTAKKAMMKDFDDRYQDGDVQLLMNKAAFLDPWFKNFLILVQVVRLVLH